MSTPLPATPDASDEHLRLLSIFHYVWAGLGVFGVVLLFAYFGFLQAFMTPEMMANARKPPPPEFFAMFGWLKWMMLGFALFGLATTVLNVVAAASLRRRRQWMLCMIAAGLNCLSMPLGTILGVFTIVVLTKDPVRRSFR